MKRRDLLQAILFGVSVPVGLLPVYSAELSDEISAADALFRQSEFSKAREIYKKIRNLSANKNRPDDWKYCTLRIVRCSRRLRDLSLATEEYFQYCRVDSTVPLESIPIIWSASSSLIQGTKPDPQASLNMLRQITVSHPNPAAELLSAAVLSSDREFSLRNIGLHHLRKLANPSESGSDKTENKLPETKSSENPAKQNETLTTLTNNVMLLAGVLLWRERIPILRNEKDLTAMKRLLLRIPEPLRAGALFLYGKAAAQVGLLEEAVISIMNIPVQYAEDTVLVMEALQEAAKILDKLNRKKQAEQLRNEAKELELNSEF
ncbi:MAG: hypothetical protein LBT09_00205 [Planctomycetaceae bacterium]|jgi:tetratricopeptide (TPR) repeat protein|nr:hypothetical protein [Planctomycetaceae bacterium]